MFSNHIRQIVTIRILMYGTQCVLHILGIAEHREFARLLIRKKRTLSARVRLVCKRVIQSIYLI